MALRRAGERPTIVKLVQSGANFDGEDDAARAGRLAGVPYAELVRYAKPADAWSAAIAAGTPPPSARELADALGAFEGAVVAEGLGGLLAPLNAAEHLGDVAVRAKLAAVLTVGLRLGCLIHALLTLGACRDLNLPVAGAVLVERWGPTDSGYRADVARVLEPHLRIFGTLPFGEAERESVEAAAKLFEPLVKQER